MKKKKGVAKLKKDLWKLFSQYIRLRDKFTCFTCGKKGEGAGIHAGHFITKATCPPPLYFSEFNTHAQCFRCNIHLSGNWTVYLERMVELYGQAIVDDLLAQRHQAVKWTPETYERMIEVYKEKVISLQNP